MKTTRQIAIADHLWVALGRMAEEMGADREALVNQALHTFARLNGFVVPGAPEERGPPQPPPVPERAAEARQVLDAAARLERAMSETPAPEEAPAAALSLSLVREDGTAHPVGKERFLIGRGHHCDLVIDSAKVSREHAVVVRDASGWAIEDLGSSNGTWHRRERVSRRRIEDGDEFYVCSEKLRCVLR